MSSLSWLHSQFCRQSLASGGCCQCEFTCLPFVRLFWLLLRPMPTNSVQNRLGHSRLANCLPTPALTGRLAWAAYLPTALLSAPSHPEVAARRNSPPYRPAPSKLTVTPCAPICPACQLSRALGCKKLVTKAFADRSPVWTLPIVISMSIIRPLNR